MYATYNGINPVLSTVINRLTIEWDEKNKLAISPRSGGSAVLKRIKGPTYAKPEVSPELRRTPVAHIRGARSVYMSWNAHVSNCLLSCNQDVPEYEQVLYLDRQLNLFVYFL